ncbi:MAG: hypothetical protein AMS18_17645 [Gemmatimonas sp. SG8_17]|nr:MAG: hypothetical protein AMS18_17645 [Gemmatimonas sp. SG8_17]
MKLRSKQLESSCRHRGGYRVQPATAVSGLSTHLQYQPLDISQTVSRLSHQPNDELRLLAGQPFERR